MTNNIDFDSLYGNVNAVDYLKSHIANESLVLYGKITPKAYSINGEIAVWKELYGASAKSKSSNVREDMTADDVRVKLHTIPMDDYIGFDIKVNGFDVATNKDLDLIKEQSLDALALSVRKNNEKLMTFLQTAGNYTATADTSSLTSSNYVEKILAAKAEFKTANAAYGLVPSVCMVSFEGEALLVAALGAALKQNGTTEIGYKGYIGSAYGLDFVATDLIDSTNDFDFLLLCPQSVLCPTIDIGEPQVNPYIEGAFKKVEVLWKKPIGFGAIAASRIYAHIHA